MKKKHVISFILTAVLVMSIISASPALAVDVGKDGTYLTPPTQSVMKPMAEETMWYFRTTNGYLEKRLWSITQGRWLTDWMPAV